jgi:1-deoxy-D-xylulose-5-phosphate synthase
MVIACPADEAELVHMTTTLAAYDGGPSAVRYPRGFGTGVDLPSEGDILTLGKGRILSHGQDIALLSLGTMLSVAEEVADRLADDGISVTLADARFAKPFDTEMLRSLASTHQAMLIIEEGSSGGFSALVMQFLANEGLLDKGLRVRVATLPDSFIDHAERGRQLCLCGLDAKTLYERATALCATAANSAAKRR